ncbi:hypothetical protein [Columbia Basin potato purple top phytoplasma]|uniref:Uncharacterized protein n=1 Tax=Columbia Basin potato purple top phytoplasma TaxID=307134 RepID=A0ABT5L999_9MOLU|nr:hypothetical protein [Columbia Basin potato purple top phytoplasma]MDC9032165.1 hypothetical protein [Columbia Basin potato purple top phytoplasma]
MTKIQTKNKIFTTLVVLISVFFTIASLYALKNYFAQQKKEKIQLMNNCPSFNVERTGGNNEDKTLLPIPIPNLNVQKYHHLITVEHEATLNSNGMELTTPLYLKISTRYDTQETFNNSEKYFNLSLKVNNQEYEDTKRPLMILENGVGTMKIQISIEQKEIIKEKDPQLALICDYELVDTQGKAFSGGSQTIENKITQLS